MKTFLKVLALIAGFLLVLVFFAFLVVSLERGEKGGDDKREGTAYIPTVMDRADSAQVSKIDFTKYNKNITSIDLGLPSGTKWADRNVGANSPFEYGGLYRYGNPKTKIDGSNNICADKSNIIGTNHDVAKTILGSKWNTPSINQIEELLRYCKSHLLTIRGKKVMAIIGPNDNYILLPLVGCMFNFGRCEEEMWGLYEAGNLSKGNGFQLIVSDDGRVDKMDSQMPGYYGCAIRAIEVTDIE